MKISKAAKVQYGLPDQHGPGTTGPQGLPLSYPLTTPKDKRQGMSAFSMDDKPALSFNMKKINPFTLTARALALCLLILGLQGTAPAQNCNPGNITLTSQAAVDNFQNTYGPCTDVTGNLTIQGNGITNVDGLADLTSVGGDLLVRNNASLTDVDGFAALTSVGRALWIRNNALLTNLDGLVALSSVGGFLAVYDNSSLANVDGFDALISVGGSVAIVSNPSLMNVDGFSSLTSVAENLSVSVNASLTDVDGFASLTSVGDNLDISNNGSLANVDGLVALASVGGYLLVRNNPMLANVDGFVTLTSVGDNLDISNNGSLANVDGFVALTSVGGDLSVGNNGSLTNVDGFAALTSVVGYLLVNNNALADVDGFAALTYVGEGFTVRFNPLLTNVDGLAALSAVGNYFQVYRNSSLTDCCGIHSLLNTPGAIGGSITIFGNATGCDSPSEVNTYCEDADGDGVNLTDGDCDDNSVTGPNSFPGNPEVCDGVDNNCDGQTDEGFEVYNANIMFTSQAQLAAWSPCITTINGSVVISGASITDLSPLSNISSITGNLTIQYTGLSGLSGLESLGTLGGTLTIYFNSSLSTLNGLNTLATVGGSFLMYYNFQLSDCCAVHGLINGGVAYVVNIFFNKVGCNSLAEINTNCALALVGGNSGSTFATANGQPAAGKEMSLYPNPAQHEVTVRFSQSGPTATLRITDLLGRVVFEKELKEGTDRMVIDLQSGIFENGLYLVSLFEDGEMRVKQLVLQQ
jgi:hypothetical protein